MPNFTDLLSQAKKMQEKMKETQDALKKIEVEGVAGGNAVKIIMNGEGELKKIFFEDSLFKESKEIIEDLIVAAHTDAKAKLKKERTYFQQLMAREVVLRYTPKIKFRVDDSIEAGNRVLEIIEELESDLE